MKLWFRRWFNKPRQIVIFWTLYILILNFAITYRLFKHNFFIGFFVSVVCIWFMTYVVTLNRLILYYINALPNMYRDIAINCINNKLELKSIEIIGNKVCRKQNAIQCITDVIIDDVSEYVIYACLVDGNKATSLEYNRSDMPYLAKNIAKFIYKLIVDNPRLIMLFHTMGQDPIITPNANENHYDSN